MTTLTTVLDMLTLTLAEGAASRYSSGWPWHHLGLLFCTPGSLLPVPAIYRCTASI